MIINGENKTHYTFREWLEVSGVKRSTAHYYWKHGIGPARRKIGKHVYISIEDAKVWAESFGDGLKKGAE